ncbi:unnamed protein product [Musa acuminata subsp. burmannicoides]
MTGDNYPLHPHLATFQANKVVELVDLAAFSSCMTTAKGDASRCNVGAHAVGRELPVPDQEKTWKNIVKMEPGYMTTMVVVAFKLVAANQSYVNSLPSLSLSLSLFGLPLHRFLLTVYCLLQILDHEDNAMMGPLKLLP